MRIDVVTNPSKDDWDSVLRESGEGDYRQSYQYGEYSIASESLRVMRLLARSDRPLGVLQGTYGRKPFSRLLMGGSSGGGPVVVAPSQKSKEEVASALLASAREIARGRLAASERVHRFRRQGLVEVFTKGFGFKVTRESSIFTVPLRIKAAEAWSRMDSPKRRNIKKARDSGVEVRSSQAESDVDIFYSIFVDFARQKSFEPFPRRRASSYLKAFGPDDMVRVFVAEKGGHPLASALVLNHLDAAFCPYTCSFEEAKELRANDLLHWSIIEWACGRGLSAYNMGEVFTDPASAQHGLYRWKKGFGGHLDDMLIMDHQLLPNLGRLRAALPR